MASFCRRPYLTFGLFCFWMNTISCIGMSFMTFELCEFDGTRVNSSSCCMESVLRNLCLVQRLDNWDNVAILYETNDGQKMINTFLSHCADVKTTLFDVTDMTSVEIRSMFLTLYGMKSDGARIILMPGTQTLQILKIANDLDINSNRTTNYRTNSKWVILCHEKIKITFEKLTFNLVNVLIMGCFNGKFEIYTIKQNVAFKLKCWGHDNDVTSCKMDDFYPSSRYRLNGRHILIGTIESTSYFDLVVNDQNKTVYSGMVVQLAEMIAQTLNFTFSFVQPHDCKWGLEVNGVWEGMIGQLVRQEVDLVIADLAATTDRMEVVDFIFPAYLIQNIGLLYRNWEQSESNWSKVFSPLHAYVYYCILGAIIVVGIIIVVFDRRVSNEVSINPISPSYIVYVIFSLVGFVLLRDNKFWPKKESVRILVAFFWIFCVVLSAAYVGNLTAKLAETKENKAFNSLEELVKLEDWKWGSSDELTQEIIRKDTSPVVQELWEGMVRFNQSDPSVLLLDPSYHLDRLILKNDKYAYIVFDAKYFAYNQKDCLFKLLNDGLGSINIAMAVTKDSYLKSELERVMLELSKTGLLEKLEENHYIDNRPLSCQTTVKSKRIVRMYDMTGTVLVSGIGLGVALFVLVLEMIIKYVAKGNNTMKIL
ncbi:hypothetical protein SNE40_006057 [Patella caerulea]|uniref:Uncharacterized protein n=2 Tax=Patella caerulea TaxID=87958 RepID=A0AAN8K6P7_PATCE